MSDPDAIARDRAIERGAIPATEPCTCCAAPVSGHGDCGVHLPTWSLFCIRCAVVLNFTTPRGVIAA